MRRRVLLAALAGVMAVALGACGGDEEALTIYSGREEELVGSLLESFSEDTGIEIEVRYGDSADLALLIAEEGDRTPADVFFSQSPGAVGFLAEEGLLASIDPAILDDVDEQFRSGEGLWVGLTARQRVLVYNTEEVNPDELPGSVFEVTGDEYAGRVAVAPTNGSFQDFVTAMRQVHGEDETASWLEAMAAGGAPTYDSNSSIVEAVGRGEVDMGLVNHYYNYRFLDEDPDHPTANHQFDEGDIGSLMLASTASVLEGSGNTEAAGRFIEWMLSEDAQEFFSEDTFEYPLVAGTEPAGVLAPLESLGPPEFDIDQLGGGLEETARLISESGLE